MSLIQHRKYDYICMHYLTSAKVLLSRRCGKKCVTNFLNTSALVKDNVDLLLLSYYIRHISFCLKTIGTVQLLSSC